MFSNGIEAKPVTSKFGYLSPRLGLADSWKPLLRLGYLHL
jgi:hypothetical protein